MSLTSPQGSSATSKTELAIHGWTAVPRDPDEILRGKRQLYPAQPTRVQDIEFPLDDHLVEKVHSYAKQHLPDGTFNHSMRVFYFASAMLHQFPEHACKLSRPTLALACLLHDIGTTEQNIQATHLSFEFYGGMLALRLLQDQLGAPQCQSEAVAEAVFRHQDLGSTGQLTFLCQLLQLATVYDNTGQHEALVHDDTKKDVVRVFPRLGWSACFAATIHQENGLKPWSHTTKLGEQVFPNKVLNNPVMAPFEK